MPKKKVKIKSHKKATKKSSKGLLKTLFGFLVLFLVVSATLGIVKGMKPACANSISCINDLSGNYENTNKAIFLGQDFNTPNLLAKNPVPIAVLGDTTAPKHIYVDLTNQKLYAYEGDKVVMSFMVSTGKWNHTPTGDFKIWIKLRYTRMSGGSGADYYDLPNVPYTMFYYNDKVPKSDGYSIHGAYWHNNFGHPMSHGCVNMRPADAGLLYAWANPPTTGNVTYATDANPGTVVTVYGQTPSN